MGVRYEKLFHLMIDKKISNAELKQKAGFSANIITRLKRNEYISMDSIERICKVLSCSVDDILEFDEEDPRGLTPEAENESGSLSNVPNAE